MHMCMVISYKSFIEIQADGHKVRLYIYKLFFRVLGDFIIFGFFLFLFSLPHRKCRHSLIVPYFLIQ